MVQVEAPARCEKCSGQVEQDSDTLDTWFSSALWPFAVFGWPDEQAMETAYQEGAYPTSLMITGRDILYLWIVRMVMTSLDFTGRIPFRQVLIHPTVLNPEGRRMSKSLGTGVDPLDLIQEYGSDATRFSLLYQCSAEQDIRFGEARTEMARNFCNKIWNAGRFVLRNLGEDFRPNQTAPDRVKLEGSLAERWILSRYGAMLTQVGAALERYEMGEAARTLYDFFWSEFCDWFVEMCKPALRGPAAAGERARETLWFVLEGTLRALHPFLPFITEEIWQQLPGTGEALIIAHWPDPDPTWRDEAAEREMEAVRQVVVAARKLRADQSIAPARRVRIAVTAGAAEARQVLEANKAAILLLGRGKELALRGEEAGHPAMAEVVQWGGEAIAVSVGEEFSREELEAQRRRLERERDRLEEEEARLGEKLRQTEFLSRAPRPVIERTQAHHAQVRDRLGAVAEQLRGVVRSLEE